MKILDTEVKYFDISSVGVPKLTNTWGCMIDFLDVVLVNGSTSQPILSFSTTIDLEDEDLWITTLRLNSGHSLKANVSVIKINGASDPKLNAEHRIQTTTNTTATIAIKKSDFPEKPLDSVETDVVTFTLPPLGYTKVFGEPGTQKAVYKVVTADDKYCYFRVDNSTPIGHDPTASKFSRVSMFEEMAHIDDYDFKSNVKKAPCYSDFYNRTEEDIYNVWFNIGHDNARYYYFQNGPDSENTFYCLMGDSSTFYLHFQSLRGKSSTQRRDETYLFGKYSKNQYREDPLPFALRVSRRDTTTSNYFLPYNDRASFTRDETRNNCTFSTDSYQIFETPASHNYSLWLDDTYRSGANTRVNFKPYMNEINLNLGDIQLRFYRRDITVMEGKYRGLKSIMANLQDYQAKAPKMYDVVTQDSTKFIVIPDRDYYEEGYYCIQLNNWSDK